MEFKMGVYDAPEKQKQPLFEMYPLKTNVAVFGGPMTGKTTFVKTLLVRLHEKRGPDEEEIYIVDFGGSLGDFGNLQNICAAFDNSSEENIKRVFRTVEKRLEDNADHLGGRSYYEVYRENPKACPPHLTFIIENINAFLADERYESYRDRLTKLCRDGLSKGLTVVITGRDTAGVGRLLTNFAQKIGLGLNADEYMEIFGCKILPPMRLPGRGIVNIESNHYEFQCFLPFPVREQLGLAPLLRIAEKNPNPRRMKAFGKELTFDDLKKQSTKPITEMPDQVLLGLDYYEHKPVILDYAKNKAIGIYGKRKFGKTNLLKLILDGIRKQHPDYRFVYLDDGRKQLCQVMNHPIPANAQEREKVLDGMMSDIKRDGYFRSGDEFYLRDPDQLVDFLIQNNYVTDKGSDYAPGFLPGLTGEASQPGVPSMKPLQESPKPTVFVVDNKMFYQVLSSKGKRLLNSYLPELINRAEDTGNLVIFAEIRNMAELHREEFNRLLTIAFLLDNLGEFIIDRGNKSVFKDMDAKEMKTTYARCEMGDGYIYTIDADELQKVKFIKTVR